MIKNTALLCLLLATQLICLAQSDSSLNLDVNLGSSYKTISSFSTTEMDARRTVLENGESELLIIGYEERKAIIHRYSLTDKKEISQMEYTDFPQKTVFVKVLETNGRVYFLYAKRDKTKDRWVINAREVDRKKGVFLPEKTVIEVAPRPISRNILQSPIYLRVSSDQSKVMVAYEIYDFRESISSSHPKWEYHVLDADLQLLWSNIYEPAIKKLQIQVVLINLGVTNSGTVFVLHHKGHGYRWKILPKVHLTVANADEVRFGKLELPENKYFMQLSINENERGNLFFEAPYADYRDSTKLGGLNGPEVNFKAKGIVRFEAELSGKVISFVKTEFPKEFFIRSDDYFDMEKLKSKNIPRSEGIVGLYLRHLAKDEMGNSVFVMERMYERGESSTVPRNLLLQDLIVAKINPQGALLWIKRFPKRQLSPYMTYPGKRSSHQVANGMGIKYTWIGNMHCIFYMDNLNNANRPLTETPSTYYTTGLGSALSHLFCAQINDQTGQTSKQMVTHTKNVDGENIKAIFPGRLIQLSRNELVTEIYLNGKNRAILNITPSQ